MGAFVLAVVSHQIYLFIFWEGASCEYIYQTPPFPKSWIRPCIGADEQVSFWKVGGRIEASDWIIDFMFLIEASVHILAVRVYILFVRGLFFNGCVILSGAYYGSDVLNHLNIACAHMLHHNALRLTREGRSKMTAYVWAISGYGAV